MSWNQTAPSCDTVKFKRQFTLNQLSKTCSKPGSVLQTVTQKLIQYEGTFHVTLAQEDSDWSLRSLVPLAKWNFPFEFSFTRDFKIVSTLVAQYVFFLPLLEKNLRCVEFCAGSNVSKEALN